MVTLFLGMDDWVPTKFAEGYSGGHSRELLPHPLPTTHVAFLMTSNHNNKNQYNNCSGDKQSNSQTLISLTAIPHKEACRE